MLNKVAFSVAHQIRHTTLMKDAAGDTLAAGILAQIDLSGLDELDNTAPELQQVALDAALTIADDAGERSTLFNQLNTRAIAFAKERAAELVTQVTESTRNDLQVIISSGMDSKLTKDDIADLIANDTGFSEERAQLIARTEISIANGKGALDSYKEIKALGYNIKKEWLPDNDPCPECQANADQGPIDVEDEFESGDDTTPAHPRCLVGDTDIAASGVTRSFKRRFHGKVCVINIGGEKPLTITPNHPVLTNRGWIAAGGLQLTDRLAKCVNPSSALTLFSPHDNHIISRIEEVSGALLMAGEVTTCTVPTSPVDFHGDGIPDGYVDIISTNSFLKDTAYGLQGSTLSAAHLGGTVLHADGAAALLLPADSAPTNGGISGGSASGTNGCGDTSSLLSVSLADGGNGQAKSNEISANSQVRTPDHPCEINARLSGEIEFVEILDFSISEDFCGHVYNLSTKTGWYIAQNIIVHNCECTTISVYEEGEQ